METGTANAATEIRGMLDNWAAATRAQDLEGVMAHYAPDVLAFDAINQLQFKGRDWYTEHYAECLPHFPPKPIFDIHELRVDADGDVAFGHFLLRCGGADESGKEEAAWMRGTVCCRKKDGEWRVVHEHFSAPFDPETMKALTDLEP